MVKPLDVYLGHELPKDRQDAIKAVRASGMADDESMEFWDRVRRVQDVCATYTVEAAQVAKALSLIAPHMSCDGEYGRMAIFEGDIDRLLRDLARIL